MSFLGAFHGTLAITVLCLLLFTEETGVPLPLAPGDLVLLAAGVLIASHQLSPWVFVPTAMVSATLGALVGYSWARLLGARGLRALAERLRVSHRLSRTERRLQAAGATGILVGRLLIPGMRVNTTLLAGALRVGRREFAVGLIPSVVIWVVLVTGAGVVAGVPVEHFLAAVDQVALQGAILLVLGTAGYLVARHAPPRRRRDEIPLCAPARWRLALALAIDLATVATAVTGGDVLGRQILGIGGINDVLDAGMTVGLTAIAYIIATRGGIGVTAGEALFRVTYRSRRRGRIPPERGGDQAVESGTTLGVFPRPLEGSSLASTLTCSRPLDA